jgi:uncharacterized caspase-like protein
MRLAEIFMNLFPGSTTYLGGDKMCARQVFRKLLITLLLLAFLSTASYLSAATRGIRVVSKKGQPLYLYKDYHAVVIGVSDYDHWPTLPNAVKDAQEVAGKLRALGFKVKLIANPDSRQLKSTLYEIARRLGTEKNRALLLYYAGHGETTTLADGTDLGYIIPKDCPLQNLDPFGFDSKAVSMKEIEMLALKVRSKHMLVIFDSCFSGSLFALSRAAPTDISEKSAKPVRQFMTAGGANETVPDRSIFKVCLLQGLDGEADYNRDGYVTASELGLYLQSKVVNYTRGAQHPQFGKINNPYLDKGDFIFVLKPSRPKAAKATAPVAPPHTAKDRMSEELERLKQERKRLEAEKRILEKEKQKLAYIPKTVKSARVSLRAEPQERLTTDYIKDMVKRYDFFDSYWNVFGSFENDFVDNGDGTVTDRATGLMWQKSGSSRSRTWRRAELYIDKLNKNQSAGYSDWRLPTIDELASLIEKKDMGGLHLDPLFDKKQTHCWSADNGPELTYGSLGLFATWIVNFAEGRVKQAQWATGDLARYNNLESNYIRAVRSLESQ